MDLRQQVLEQASAWPTVLNTLRAIVDEFPLSLGIGSLSPAARQAEPLRGALALCSMFAVGCLVASWVTGNCSQVDKLWSITPAIYCWWFHNSGHPRTLLMAVLATLWGARLTYNFVRKGGYSGEEDYRWPVLRRMMPGWLFQVFNVAFIAVYQHLLLLAIALPAYVASVSAKTGAAPALNVTDFCSAGLLLFSLVLESVADQQQWAFYAARARHRASKNSAGAGEDAAFGGDLTRGFFTGGLFRLSRHPNFFFEQCIWVCFCGFGAAAVGCACWEPRWWWVGAALLVCLFQGSTSFTESLTVKKYSRYAEYQRTTSRLLPWLPGRLVPETKTE